MKQQSLKGKEAYEKLLTVRFVHATGKGLKKFIFEDGTKVNAGLVKHWLEHGVVKDIGAMVYEIAPEYTI